MFKNISDQLNNPVQTDSNGLFKVQTSCTRVSSDKGQRLLSSVVVENAAYDCITLMRPALNSIAAPISHPSLDLNVAPARSRYGQC